MKMKTNLEKLFLEKNLVGSVERGYMMLLGGKKKIVDFPMKDKLLMFLKLYVHFQLLLQPLVYLPLYLQINLLKIQPQVYQLHNQQTNLVEILRLVYQLLNLLKILLYHQIPVHQPQLLQKIHQLRQRFPNQQ